MPDPILVPSIAMLTGGGLLVARDYLKRRLEGSEDRYMALYGKAQWDASNMDLAIHCAPGEERAKLEEAFLARLHARLKEDPEGMRLWFEEADPESHVLRFRRRDSMRVEDLLVPRRGLYLDLDLDDRIRVVWNHMQTDGVGMWSALRTLFDPNPPLIPYDDVPTPPPVLPEIIALPSVARRLVWRGRLRKEEGLDEVPLQRGLVRWDAGPIRDLKEEMKVPFNLLTSALVIDRIFHRHPDRPRLNVGLTAYFPFLEGRNKYGVFLCKVLRADLAGIVRQLERQTKNPLKNWGMSATQSYALGRMPDGAFARLVDHYRKAIDVLVSSLPVGQLPITLDGIPTAISTHPWELTLPYYFLLVGTRVELHVSYTSRFSQDEDFLDLEV
jgi:hypothetical protein